MFGFRFFTETYTANRDQPGAHGIVYLYYFPEQRQNDRLVSGYNLVVPVDIRDISANLVSARMTDTNQVTIRHPQLPHALVYQAGDFFDSGTDAYGHVVAQRNQANKQGQDANANRAMKETIIEFDEDLGLDNTIFTPASTYPSDPLKISPKFVGKKSQYKTKTGAEIDVLTTALLFKIAVREEVPRLVTTPSRSQRDNEGADMISRAFAGMNVSS